MIVGGKGQLENEARVVALARISLGNGRATEREGLGGGR